MTAIGIDFGTSEIRLAISQPNGSSQYVGNISIQNATRLSKFQTHGKSLKSWLDDAIIAYQSSLSIHPEELTSRLLAIAREHVSQKLDIRITNCAITIPCGYGARGRQHLQEASRRALFTNSRLVLEPMAVLLEKKKDEIDKIAMVCSWGESGCNILLAHQKRGVLEELASRGESSISGSKLTDVVLKHLRQKYKEQTGREPELTPELVNLQLSEATRALQELSLKTEIEIRSFASQRVQQRPYQLTRTELLTWIKDILESCLTSCNSTLQKGGLEKPQMIDELWLVGGISNIPYVKEQFSNWWGREPLIANAQSAALGAARYAGSLWETNNTSFGNTTVIQPQPTPLPIQSIQSPKSSTLDTTSLSTPDSTARDQTPLTGKNSVQEILPAKLTQLVGSLKQVEKLLGDGDVTAAGQSMQDALEVINNYRAQVLFAEGKQILIKAQVQMNQRLGLKDSLVKKQLTKEVKGLLSMAYEKTQEALRLDHNQDNYRVSLKEIETQQENLEIEELYDEALEEKGQNHLDRAHELFEKILKINPNHEYCKKQYALVLQSQYEKKKNELSKNWKRLKPKEQENEVRNIKNLLMRRMDMIGFDPSLKNDLLSIENILKTLKK